MMAFHMGGVTHLECMYSFHVGMVICPDPAGNPVHPTRTGPGIPRKNGGGGGYPRFTQSGAGAGAGDG